VCVHVRAFMFVWAYAFVSVRVSAYAHGRVNAVEMGMYLMWCSISRRMLVMQCTFVPVRRYVYEVIRVCIRVCACVRACAYVRLCVCKTA